MIDINNPEFDAIKAHNEFLEYFSGVHEGFLRTGSTCDFLDVHFWLQHKNGHQIDSFSDAKMLLKVWQECGFITYDGKGDDNISIYRLKAKRVTP